MFSAIDDARVFAFKRSGVFSSLDVVIGINGIKTLLGIQFLILDRFHSISENLLSLLNLNPIVLFLPDIVIVSLCDR